MLKESKISISEILNYGYPYHRGIDIYNEILNQLFNKKDINRIIDWKDKFSNELKTHYNFPSYMIDEYMNNGNFFSISFNEETSLREVKFNYCGFVEYIVNNFCTYTNSDKLIVVTGSSKEVKDLSINKLKELKNNILEIDDSDFISKSLKSMPLTGYATGEDSIIEILNKIIVSIKKLYKDIYVDDKYNIDDIFENCDKEKLLFHTMVRGINDCTGYDYEDGFIYTIIKYFKEKEEDSKVNITYIGYLDDNTKPKVINYKYQNFLHSFQNYMLAHPEISMIDLDFDSNGMSVEEFNIAINKFNEETMQKYQEVSDIEFLPSKPTGVEHFENHSEKTNKETLLALKKKQFYALNESQIYMKLRGKAKLKGYTAMVFKNGYVILEINDIKNNKIVTTSGAAYIMPLPMFNELCECSRTELRNYINVNPNSNVSYQCHKGNWMEIIQGVINLNTGVSLNEDSKVLVKNN